MALANVLQQAHHGRHLALGVIDCLLKALCTHGSVPPPLGEIHFDVVGQTLPVARSFDPPRRLSSFRNRTGFFILDGTYTSEAEPSWRYPLAAGTYAVRVSGPLYEDQEFSLLWPPPDGVTRIPLNQPNRPDNIELRPGAAYALPDVAAVGQQLGPTILRGSLFSSEGNPLSGVLVQVINLPPFLLPAELPALGEWPFLETRSNARGDWLLVLPGRRYLDPAAELLSQLMTKNVDLRIHGPSRTFDLPVPSVELGREHAVKNTALRGQVLGAGGRPIALAQITTSVGPATSVTQADGRWSLYFELDQPTVNSVTVTATTADGASLSNANVNVENGKTALVPAVRFS